ncbi:hypothetical protein HAX54_025841 [Datura stramonium]|uniref:Uncharacterized protein n=1 Tax=Datura stramonium TaxID=4076 RepID=A0ABS8S6M2_DATST|nr:hypothetical protein [Datura stramonium]
MCDYSFGKCVFDSTSCPLYNESGFPYMSAQLASQKHGRPNTRIGDGSLTTAISRGNKKGNQEKGGNSYDEKLPIRNQIRDGDI